VRASFHRDVGPVRCHFHNTDQATVHSSVLFLVVDGEEVSIRDLLVTAASRVRAPRGRRSPRLVTASTQAPLQDLSVLEQGVPAPLAPMSIQTSDSLTTTCSDGVRARRPAPAAISLIKLRHRGILSDT